MIKFNSLRRYQDCSIIEKIYRRLKYQPICVIIALFYTVKHLFMKDGKPILVWKILSVEWCLKAKWYYDIDEVWNRLNLEEGIDEDEQQDF